MSGEDLISPRPLADTLPAVYYGDTLTQQLCEAFDDALGPIFATLDCLPAYLDPRTTAEDMLDWLANWIGLTMDGHEDAARKRELIVTGASIMPWRGTARSIRHAVSAMFNEETQVIESGSVNAPPDSETEGGGGGPAYSLLVRIITDDPDTVDRRRLYEVVDAAKPAHVPHRIEVLKRVAP
jgi:phage tail-like protein